jgi:antitoxin component of RelBE/YafQ-DinJ toxin-antitoxin module
MKDRVRVTVRVDNDTFERMKYWAESRGVSVNEWLRLAIEQRIRWENLDFDVPTAEQRRLAQLVDVTSMLVDTVHNMEAKVDSGFRSLMDLTHGSSYLVDHMEEDDIV